MDEVKNCLTPERKSRGVIPEKVSELENDAKYITQDELEKMAFESIKGTYTGASTEEAEVIVDNLYRTIKVRLLKSLEDDLKTLLPQRGGNFQEGVYLLKAVVSGNSPAFSFLESGDIIKTNPYFYGNVSVDSTGLTDEIVKSLSNGGDKRENKTYTYHSYKQRQVFAYPADYGELSSISLVKVGIDVIDLFEKVRLVINGVNYLAYISINSSTGEYEYRFTY